MACQSGKMRHTARVSDQRMHMPQLDGLRAVAMCGVIYHHWLPAAWRFHFPTEAGLFFFFVLSGFLMTQGLLRERESMPLGTILKRFHLKRLVRIYPAYYAALAVAAAFGVKEIWLTPQWWLLNSQNFLILNLGYWPHGVSHFWTLAVEQQYYLVWPLVILLTPRKLLCPALILLTLISPLTRLSSAGDGWLSMDLIPWGVIDDFALGSLLALLMHRGVVFPHRIMDLAGLIALGCYGYLYVSWEMDHHIPHWCHFQQTCLALAFMAPISRAAHGRCGVASRWLEHPLLVSVGQWSYGIYLFHNLAPFLVGKVCWFLWSPALDPSLSLILRFPLYAAATAAMTWACRRWVEIPASRWLKR
jgi:peptidoglycan/LPS O-acetylase OafA/YrhL